MLRTVSTIDTIEWVIATAITPAFLVLVPLFQGAGFLDTGRRGQYLVLCFALTSTLFIGDLFYLYKRSKSPPEVLVHAILSFLLFLAVAFAFVSRHADGMVELLSNDWVWASMAITVAAVLLGLCRPTKAMKRRI